MATEPAARDTNGVPTLLAVDPTVAAGTTRVDNIRRLNTKQITIGADTFNALMAVIGESVVVEPGAGRFLIEGGNLNAVLVSATDLDIRDLDSATDSVSIEGGNKVNVVTEPLDISTGRVFSKTFLANTAQTLLDPTAFEAVIVGSILITNFDDVIVGFKVYEQGVSSGEGMVEMWAAKNGGGASFDTPLGWQLSQGQDLIVIANATSGTTAAYKVTVNYKLKTFDNPVVDPTDILLLDNGTDALLLVNGTDSILLS